MEQEREDLVVLLLEEGSHRDAIWLYQEETGASRDEAQHAVRELALRRGIHGGGNLLLPLVVLVLLAISGVIAVMAG